MKDLFCFKSRKRFTLFRENSLTGVTVFLLITLLTILFVNPTYADTKLQSPDSKIQDLHHRVAKVNIPFILNQGQTDEDVRFYANTFGGTVFVTKDGEIVYSLPKTDDGRARQNVGQGFSPAYVSSNPEGLPYELPNSKSQTENPKSKGIALKEEFLNANIKEIKGEDKPLTKVNYFKGDKTSWKTNIPTYETVNLGEIYKGIELNLKAYGNNVEKLFYVKPNTNPEKIKVKLNGADNLNVNEDGELEVKTELGIIKFTKPVAYQEEKISSTLVGEGKGEGDRKYIDVAYVVNGNEYGFKLSDYDKTKELVIDPLLASTFIGGSGGDYGRSIAIDSLGNVYISGSTSSSDFPTTPGAYDTFSSGSDAIVSKLNNDLTNLLASTFLGGSSVDSADSIAIDSVGNVYVAGRTSSSDFPTTPGAYDNAYHGGGDAFVSKLNSDLTNLLASTYLGGRNYESWEVFPSVDIDSSGNVYVTGETFSSDFPTTPGAYDTTFGGSYVAADAFISKFDSNLTTLLASTFLGGNYWDSANSITIDSLGNVYVAGRAGSSDFPATPGAYDVTSNGGDAFVSKLNSDLTNLLASTFLGGSGGDSADSIAIDSVGNVYVAGRTSSSDFPTTPGAYDTSYNDGVDAFVAKFDGDLTQLLASTFIGGSSTEGFYTSVTIDQQSSVYVRGNTSSSDYPTTPDAYDTSFNGYYDIFVSKLDSTLSTFLASTFLGGSGNDYARYRSLAIDSNGNVYVAGYTSSTDYPTTPVAYDTTHNGGTDAFVLKLSFGYILTVTKSGTGSGTVSSSPAGINCGTDCLETYAVGTLVTLTATPDSGSVFTGWSGACTGTVTCTITMDTNKSVTAVFDLQPLPSTPTQSQGQGSGTNNQGTSNAPGLQNAPGIQNAPGLQRR